MHIHNSTLGLQYISRHVGFDGASYRGRVSRRRSHQPEMEGEMHGQQRRDSRLPLKPIDWPIELIEIVK